ncbi:MAG: carboxypeptidase-like regulatory domain-containing protein, partial [Cyclobacteriaceae bacterium]
MSVPVITKAQENQAIQVSGVVLQHDSLQAMPYTSILIKNSEQGTVCDNSGYFSLFISAGDTLQFSNVGYKTAQFILPTVLATQHYSLIQLMERDTILLEQITIEPWPKVEDFMQAFLEAEVEEPQRQNTRRMQRELALLLKGQMELDKAYYDQMRYSKLYHTSGVVPPNNFLNPLTWSKFIKDWREGA